MDKKHSTPVTYDEVVQVAIRLIRQGKGPTIAGVREGLGNRGSNSTIQKHLQTWRDSLSESDLEILPPSVPNALLSHVEAFWNAAVGLAEESLAKEYESAKKMVSAAETERDEAIKEALYWKDFAKERERESIQAMETIGNLKDQVADLKEILNQRDVELTKAQQKIDAKDEQLKRDLERSEEKLQAAVQKLEQERQLERQQWAIERDTLKKEAVEANEKVAIEIARSDKQIDYWIRQVDQERENVRTERERSERIIKRLETELSLSSQREAAGRNRVDKLENMLTELNDKVEELEGMLAEAQQRCTAETARAQELEKVIHKFRQKVSDTDQTLPGNT